MEEIQDNILMSIGQTGYDTRKLVKMRSRKKSLDKSKPVKVRMESDKRSALEAVLFLRLDEPKGGSGLVRLKRNSGQMFRSCHTACKHS